MGTAVTQNLIDRNIDSRAMRKVEDGFDIVSVVEAGLIGNGCRVKLGGRMLVKLH